MDNLFLRMWQDLIQYCLNNALEGLIYLATVALFIIALIRCVIPIYRIKKRLSRGSRILKHGNNPNVWKESTFLGKGALYPHWENYLSNRLFADDNFQNACALDDYINEATVIDEPGNTAFSDAIPGLMVSLGFLGTLIGMMMGLSNFNVSDTDSTMSSMSILIDGMRYAFTTSIVGIVCSILYSLIARVSQGSTLKALGKFYEAMRNFAGAVTVDPMNQIAIYQQEQSAMIQDLTVNLTDRIGSVLEMALQPLQASLDNFVTASTREQIKGIDLIVNRFVSRMNESLNGQFDKLAYTIDQTCQWQTDTREIVMETVNGMASVSRDIIQIEQISESLIVKFDAYMTKLGTAQLQIDDGYNTVTANAKNMESVARQQANYIVQIGQMQADLKKDIASFQTVMGDFMKAVVENTNVSTGALKKVSDEMRSNGEVLNDAHKTFISGVNNELAKTMDIFDNNLHEITNQLSWVVSNIDEAIKHLPSIINKSAEDYAEELGQLVESTRRLQHAVSQATKGLDTYDGGH